MMTFQEFLEKQATKQHHKEHRARREEWIAAVGRLLEQIRAWLAESDPKKVLDVVPVEHDLLPGGCLEMVHERQGTGACNVHDG